MKKDPLLVARFFKRWIILPGFSERQKCSTVAIQISIAAFLLISTSMALAADQPITDHEALLQTARHLIEKDETSMSELQQAVAILDKNKNKFPDEVRIPIYLARAYYRIAGREEDIDLEYAAYEKVGSYAKRALEMDSQRAEAHYWYALFLLKKAEKIGGPRAFFTVRDGIRELETVRKTMPEYDNAGASRILGLLFCSAPSWTPFGDIDKCIQLAEESIRLAPDHPLNHLYLADAYKKGGDKEAAIREYRTLLSIASGLSGKQRQELRQEAINALESFGKPVSEYETTLNN